MSTAWRVLLAIGGVYAAQGLVSAIAFRGAPAVMRDGGVPLDQIGYASLLMAPWALKFAWAPAVEWLRLPARGAARSYRIILPGQALMVGLLALSALFDPQHTPLAALGLLALVALAAATVDIACDGFAVDHLRERLRGLGNSMQIGGSYVGYLVGGGILLVLVARWNWASGMLVMALVLGALTLLTILAADQEKGQVAERPHRPSLAYALRRPEVRVGLLIVVLFQVGLRLGQAMISPFLIDRGFDLASVGVIYGAGATIASLGGTVLAGAALRRADPDHVLTACLGMQVALLGLLTLAAGWIDLGPGGLVTLVLLKNAAAAAGFVALYTQMMGWSSRRQAGVDFTLFQCADAGVAAVSGVAAGMIAQHLGYGACFGLACGLSVAALLCIPVALKSLRTHRGS